MGCCTLDVISSRNFWFLIFKNQPLLYHNQQANKRSAKWQLSCDFKKDILLSNLQCRRGEHCQLWNQTVWRNTADERWHLVTSKVTSSLFIALHPAHLLGLSQKDPKTVTLISPHLHNYPTETLSINYPTYQASEKTWHIVSSIFRISILFQK